MKLHRATSAINLKSEKVTLRFQHLGNSDALNIVVFSDASLGNLPDGGTRGDIDWSHGRRREVEPCAGLFS